MSNVTPDPNTLAVARHVWIHAVGTDEELATLLTWAEMRWPGVALPKNPETLALWILSIAIQDRSTTGEPGR